jgi:hypothetical protein
MTEAEYLDCHNGFNFLMEKLAFLHTTASDRKLRLFAVGCCRQVWTLVRFEELRQLVEIAERYADGLVNDEEMKALLPTDAWVGDNAPDTRRRAPNCESSLQDEMLVDLEAADMAVASIKLNAFQAATQASYWAWHVLHQA